MFSRTKCVDVLTAMWIFNYIYAPELFCSGRKRFLGRVGTVHGEINLCSSRSVIFVCACV
jgi:hypothetical protein